MSDQIKGLHDLPPMAKEPDLRSKNTTMSGWNFTSNNVYLMSRRGLLSEAKAFSARYFA
jgi:hypothetical protein